MYFCTLKTVCLMTSARRIKMIIVFAQLLFFVANSVVCQEFVNIRIPQSVCVGSVIPVTFGYDTNNAVVVTSPTSSLGHHDTIFLPDGISCGDLGCSYQSLVNFTDFIPGAVITSVEDIKFLRINIEHSFIADIYVKITCPNLQKADIMRFGGSPNSDCASHIGSESRGWLEGQNMSHGSHFGNPADVEDSSDPCNPNATSNMPGVGWNYCWSNNTTFGYQYASGDGIIYRTGHSHNGRVDSSDVSAGINFYHPDQNFSSLIGCPLNGDWYIEVFDGFAIDNGYIFSWELSLNASLIENIHCILDSFVVEGYGATRINDSSFTISIPTEVDNDTSLIYRFMAFDTCGNVLDTSLAISIHPNWTVYVSDEVVENDLPVHYCGDNFYDNVDDHIYNLTSTYGCDSIVHYSLDVWRNEELTYDTVVCETALPLQWHGVDFNDSDTVLLQLNNIHGADSIIWLFLHSVHQDTTQVVQSICEGKPYTWIDGITYSDTDSHPIVVFPKNDVCDSILRLSLFFPDNLFQAAMTVSPNPVPTSNMRCTVADISDSRSREWFIIGRGGDTSQSVTFVYPIDYDSIEVSLLAYDTNGCEDVVSRMVYLDKAAFWPPNVFTPDEQTNNLFIIPSVDLLSGDVQVFDRAGRHIVTFDLLEGGWDGTYNGHACPQGTYVWKIKYVQKSQPQIYNEAIGTVTLLR